jgi:VIT1/CCC1 family predicted Fe2+/Mn2+ transporter
MILQAVEPGRVLDPVERISEVLFGLFMVLTFTGTFSVATAGREDVRTMLIAAIGCNTAWGFVDAVMYVLRTMVERGRRASLVHSVQQMSDAAEAHRLIAGEVGPMAHALGAAELERLRRWILRQPGQRRELVRLTRRDLAGALGVFLLVFLSTFPVVLPYMLLDDLQRAHRLSALVALGMLFVCGWGWGRHAGARPAVVGAVMVLLGVAVEAIVIALGG